MSDSDLRYSSDDDDFDNLRPSKRRKTEQALKLRSRGMAFVSNTAQNEDDDKDEDVDEINGDEDEDMNGGEMDARPSFGGLGNAMGMHSGNGGLGFGRGSQNGRFGKRPQMASFEPAGIDDDGDDDNNDNGSPDKQATPIPKQGHTGGASAFNTRGGRTQVNQNSFAARMMAKMGYKEGQGLGKDAKGIAAPIEAQRSIAGTGVGFGAEESKPRRADMQKAVGGQGPQKNLTGAPKKKKTRYEVKEIESRGLRVPDAIKASVSQTVIDLTGAEVQTRDVQDLQRQQLNVAKKLTQQDKLRRDLTLFTDGWDGMNAEIEALEAEMQRRQETILKCGKQINLFRSIADAFDSVTSTSSIQVALSQLETIQNMYHEHIDTLALTHLACSVILPSLAAQVTTNWSDPLRDTQKPLVDGLLQISDLLEIDTRARRRKHTTLFESLMLKTVIPILRDTLRTCDVPQDTPRVVDLLQIWQKVLSPWMTYTLLNDTLIPRIIQLVQKFKPGREKIDLHEWLFDWWSTFASDELNLEAFELLKVEVKRKVRFDGRVWPLWEPLLGRREQKKTIRAAVETSTPTTPLSLPDTPEFMSAKDDQDAFRTFVEEWCAENDVLMTNTPDSHDGKRLIKLQDALKGKGGVLVYLQDFVIYDRGGQEYGLDDTLLARIKGLKL